jgi:hypothetical protein
MDKVLDEKEQHAELCKLLAAEGYDVMPLPWPVVLGSTGTHFNSFGRATKEMNIPNARKKKPYSKLHLRSTHSLQNPVSQRRYLQRQMPTAERVRGNALSGMRSRDPLSGESSKHSFLFKNPLSLVG